MNLRGFWTRDTSVERYEMHQRYLRLMAIEVQRLLWTTEQSIAQWERRRDEADEFPAEFCDRVLAQLRKQEASVQANLAELAAVTE